jgi:hypothetical protein
VCWGGEQREGGKRKEAAIRKTSTKQNMKGTKVTAPSSEFQGMANFTPVWSFSIIALLEWCS